MLKPLPLVAVVIVSVVACCALGLLFWDGYYLPQKPCRPIAYPSGQRLGGDQLADNSDDLQLVETFYDDRLVPKPIDYPNFGVWHKDKLDKGVVRYWCYANDINGLTTETGCIDIKRVNDDTIIKYTLRRSEGGFSPCPSK
ncbi:MAG: hypothetical protein IT317_18990 [Anaerolineales bacterium]|nr:hypothetical protein [Anaerolineales bacterium]